MPQFDVEKEKLIAYECKQEYLLLAAQEKELALQLVAIRKRMAQLQERQTLAERRYTPINFVKRTPSSSSSCEEKKCSKTVLMELLKQLSPAERQELLGGSE